MNLRLSYYVREKREEAVKVGYAVEYWAYYIHLEPIQTVGTITGAAFEIKVDESLYSSVQVEDVIEVGVQT